MKKENNEIKSTAHSKYRQNRNLFRIAVELGMLMNVMAATHDIPEAALVKLRGDCIEEIKRINGTTVPKCNYPEKQILGDNQLETFLEAIKGHEYWCDFFYVEVMTGLRRGEICGLKWQDINFEENKLQVKRSVSVKKGGGVSIGETKTETGVRCIQMPPSVAELLKSKRQTAITEWVFPHFLDPEQPISLPVHTVS